MLTKKTSANQHIEVKNRLKMRISEKYSQQQQQQSSDIILTSRHTDGSKIHINMSSHPITFQLCPSPGITFQRSKSSARTRKNHKCCCFIGDGPKTVEPIDGRMDESFSLPLALSDKKK